jgi:hypothetical protein
VAGLTLTWLGTAAYGLWLRRQVRRRMVSLLNRFLTRDTTEVASPIEDPAFVHLHRQRLEVASVAVPR